MTQQVQKANTGEVAKKLDSAIGAVLGQKNLLGFEKAFAISTAIQELSAALTPEYMKPILAMQGNKLGFRTDKDKNGGYPEHVVKQCLIEAVLMGVQPYGNQFNIIAGNMYLTKEGVGYLLSKVEGLDYNIVCSVPKINQERTSAIVEAHIVWKFKGEPQRERIIPIPMKMDPTTSVDALIGKATRKSRAWLLNSITGFEIEDKEIVEAVVMESNPTRSDEQIISEALETCTTVEEVEQLQEQMPDAPIDLFNQKKEQLKK